MKWGLFLLGAGLAALGASLTVLGVLNYPAAVTVETSESSSISIPSGASGSFTITNVSGAQGTYTLLVIHLHATSSIVYWVSTCPFTGKIPPPCAITQNTTPSVDPYVYLSSPRLPYVVVIHVPGNASATVSMSAVLTSHTMEGLSTWEELVVLAGAIVMLVGGSLAIFLAIFLRGNPYTPPPPNIEDSGGPKDL